MALLQRLEIPFGIWFDTDLAVAIRSDKQARFVTTTLEHKDVVHKNRFFQEAVSTAPFLDAIP